MMLYVDSFVTVIVIKLGLFGSSIVDDSIIVVTEV